MDRLTRSTRGESQIRLLLTIISYEWRAYWRRFARSGLRAGNQGITLIVSALVLIKYLLLLQTATIDLERGNTTLLESLLAVVFLAWLFPLAGIARDSVATRNWLHLPLSPQKRFIVRICSLCIPPAAWMVIFGSLAICYPLGHAAKAHAGIVAGLLLIAMSWFTGLTISHLVNIPVWRKLFWLVLLALLLIVGLEVISGSPIHSLLPTYLVARAALGKQTWLALGTLATLTVVTGVAAFWSYRKSLEAAPQRAIPRVMAFVSFSLPGRLGGLVAKDFGYFRRLLDTHMGLAAAVLGNLYLLTAKDPSQSIFWSFIVIVFLPNAALAFNSFGLDNQAGLGRYTLFPLRGRSILLSKNLAYLMILSVEVLPMIVLAAWRLGVVAGAPGFVEAAALACAYLTWGNWMSVSHPLKMHFFHFANSGAALADALAGIIFGSLPGILMIYFLNVGGPAAFGGIVSLLLLQSAFYCASLVRFGAHFEQNRERIANVLS